jgi:hypothetical protein
MKTFNLAEETPLSLRDAAEWLPRRQNGKVIDWRTIERWISHGHYGVFLEGCMIGRSIFTSKESLQRFSESLAAKRFNKGKKPGPESAGANSPSHKRAKKSLAKAGFKVGK